MTTLVFIGELARFPFWPAAIEGSPLTKTLAALVVGIAAALVLYRRYTLRQRRPRRLSKEEKAALIGALDGNCLASVPVTCRFEDSEARTYADDFVAALRGGGCDAILNFEPRLDPECKRRVHRHSQGWVDYGSRIVSAGDANGESGFSSCI